MAQRTAEGIVFLVVHCILQVVSLSDGMFAVVVVGFVGVEVYFAEESGGLNVSWECLGCGVGEAIRGRTSSRGASVRGPFWRQVWEN